MATSLPAPTPKGTGYAQMDYAQQTWHILCEGAPAAAQRLRYLVDHAKSEFVQLQATNSLLNRTGFPEQLDVSIFANPEEADDYPEAVSRVRERLALLRQQSAEAKGDVEGEVIPFPSSGDQET